jgi:serine/threonine-protein kinase
MDELETIAARRIGTTVAGKWRVERVLGVGGMASVFLGHATDGSKAALKILHPELNENDELRKRFLREGPIGNALASAADACPGIVRVLASGDTEDGVAYLAMEALDGETLFERFVKRGKLTVLETLALGEQVLDTLVFAHDRGVIHRDLKPENIFLPTGGGVKLLDFGIARIMDELHVSMSSLPDKTATRTGVIMGTGAYMAPEQATGLVNEIDARTDLFALGASMFLLLSGRTVHGSLSETQEIIAAATEPPAPLASVAPGIPGDVCAVVDRALAFIKHERYPDARTMRADVRALRAGDSPPYVRAIAEGTISAGAVLFQGPPSSIVSSSKRSPRSVSPTVIEASAPPSSVARTAPDTVRAAPTRIDHPRRSMRRPALFIGAAALAIGIGVGITVMTCSGSDPGKPGAADAGTNKSVPSSRLRGLAPRPSN